MASIVTSHHSVQAVAHRRAQEERASESPLVTKLSKVVVNPKDASPAVVSSQIPSILSYGVYDELMRQYAARQQEQQSAPGSVPPSVHTRAHRGHPEGEAGEAGEAGTPRVSSVSSVATASPGPPQTSVIKHVHVMVDDMMREVFVGEPGAGEEKVAKALDLSSVCSLGEEAEEDPDGAFTILALPSPTREQHTIGDTMGGRRLDGKVVLDLEAMSPLLKEMREIERVSKVVEEVAGGGMGMDVDVECGTVEVGPQEVAGGDPADHATTQGPSHHVKRVPSLIKYFQDHARGARGARRAATSSVAKAVVDVVKKQANRVAGAKKPPLLPLQHGSSAQASENPSFEKFLEAFGLRGAFDHALSSVSRATQGRRKMLAVIALSYLVLLHVFLISGRLGG